MKQNYRISISPLEVAVALLSSQALLTHGYIIFPAASAAIRKIPGFESASLSAPPDVNTFIEQLSKTPALIQADMNYFLQQASTFAKAVPAAYSPEVLSIIANIQYIADQVGAKINSYENGVYIGYFVLAFVGLSILNWIGNLGKGENCPTPSEPYGSSGRYNSDLAAEYFSSRPLAVFSRGAEIASVASLFALGLLSDLVFGKLVDPKQEEKRADQLTEVLTRLGPTFIKVGQSLSIRTDLLRPAYIKGLTKLQDCVPSFDTCLARAIIERELGQPADSIFLSGIGPDARVVAAASLGQVYKAVLRSDFSEVNTR